VPQIPKAAGKQLSQALTEALGVSLVALQPDGGDSESWVARAMCRWLQAATLAEPQVLRRLFEVGDITAMREVLVCLNSVPLFRDLKRAYDSLLDLGLREDFPSLQFEDSLPHHSSDMELSLNTCGELWVLLLLLLPEHLQTAVAKELGERSIVNDLMKTVRGPWALPLEALRWILAHVLQPPRVQQCS
jgi:hypothetical protein